MRSYTIRITTLLLVAFLSCASVLAQYNLSQPIVFDPNVKVGKLANGLTYYIRKNAKPEKKVELRLVINAGSILEDNDQRGLAHFMEHMNFNGLKHFPKNELVDYLQKIGVQFGADLNAYTSFDETVYILPVSTDDPKIVEQGFTVLEDWAGNNLFDRSEIEKERGVVLEESRLSKGAGERMQRVYFPKLFNGSRYAERLPIGQEATLKTFKPEVLERFYKQWYRPNLMAVVVVGDIDPAVAEAKIKSHFSSFKNPASVKARPNIIEIKNRVKPEALILTDEEQVSSDLEVFNFIRPTKQAKTWSDYRQKIVDELVSSLINQRLQELTQKSDPPFVYAFTGNIPFIRGYDADVSYAVLGDNPTKDAVYALVAEKERARKYGFLSTEIERAKASLLNGAQNAYNERTKLESGRIVQGYISHFLQHTPTPGVEARYQFLQQVLPSISAKEINEVAKKIPASNNAFALLLAPAKLKSKLPNNTELLKELVDAVKQPVSPYTEKAIAGSLLDKMPSPGKITSQTTNAALGTTDMVLSNGVTITLKPTTLKNDQVVMDAWRKGGIQKYTLAEKYNAKHAAHIVDEMGLKDLTPTELQKFLSGKTLNVTPYLNDYEEGIEGSSSVRDFENFLQVVHLYFTQPRKDEGLFKSYVNKEKSQLQFITSNPQFYFQDTLLKIIYNSNPWAPSLPSEAEYNAIDLDKSFNIYQKVFGNAYGMHFTFVGNIDPETARPLLEKYLGSLPAKEQQGGFKDNGVRPVKGVVEANIKKGKEQQSLITILYSGETKVTPEEQVRFRAMIDALNIRIIEKLREEMSGMYSGGLNGSLARRPAPSYSISANLPCGPENVEKLTEAFFEIIEKAKEKGIEQKDLDKVKETLKKQYRTGIQSNDFWLTSLSNAWIDETNPENVLSFEKRLDALTVNDLQEAVKKYFDNKNYVKVVLYPENAKVKEGIIKKQM